MEAKELARKVVNEVREEAASDLASWSSELYNTITRRKGDRAGIVRDLMSTLGHAYKRGALDALNAIGKALDGPAPDDSPAPRAECGACGGVGRDPDAKLEACTVCKGAGSLPARI